MSRAKSVDDYIETASKYKTELTRLRDILRATPLEETVKWGGPCYTWRGRNIVGIGAFKAYFGLWFHQGALLDDDAGVLVNAQEGKTRALRQWRMCSATDIKPAIIRRYVKHAIAVVDEGREIKADRGKAIEVPEALSSALRRERGATAAFRGLSPGKQREYAEHVASAKREDTKTRRIAKILPMILAGAGLNDKYR
ncbi:MAG: YdeI/OmpD-associated family protein [Woeseiaceae bacterium]|nr:YdeI/OmpD-associated family protein [Woeseiaceae bacterium]